VRGAEVNPKCKPGKHPPTRRGHKEATTDPARILQWWSRWPDANIGILTGRRSGLIPSRIEALGVEFDQANRHTLLG
jgi:hypothetical protein